VLRNGTASASAAAPVHGRPILLQLRNSGGPQASSVFLNLPIGGCQRAPVADHAPVRKSLLLYTAPYTRAKIHTQEEISGIPPNAFPGPTGRRSTWLAASASRDGRAYPERARR
jgi:hypothetical protein